MPYPGYPCASGSGHVMSVVGVTDELIEPRDLGDHYAHFDAQATNNTVFWDNDMSDTLLPGAILISGDFGPHCLPSVAGITTMHGSGAEEPFARVPQIQLPPTSSPLLSLASNMLVTLKDTFLQAAKDSVWIISGIILGLVLGTGFFLWLRNKWINFCLKKREKVNTIVNSI
jgi:hypothetical protein